MPLHEKRFDPKGTLVVAKASGLRFGGRTYAQGEQITDPLLTLRKARQLYFQNKLCYDYEMADTATDRAEAAQARAIAEARIAEENAAIMAQAAEQAEADRVAAEARAEQQARDMARAIEQANISSGRVPNPAPQAAAPALTELPVEATTGFIAPVEPVVEPVIEIIPAELPTQPSEDLVVAPATSEVVIEQPEVAPAPRRRRASSAAGDTSEAQVADGLA